VGTTYVEAIDCFANGPAGRVLGLTLADGSERTLTLRDYY